MKVHLLRHTETALSKGICYGQTDVDLKDDYRRDFALITERVDKIGFDAMYCSPLKRCVLVADHINKGNKYSIRYDDRLKEMNFGRWELKHWNEIESFDHAKLWFHDFVNVRCPEGESYMDLIHRVERFVVDLKKQNENSSLVVCHAGVIRAFNCVLNHLPASKSFELKVDYGQIISFDIS